MTVEEAAQAYRDALAEVQRLDLELERLDREALAVRRQLTAAGERQFQAQHRLLKAASEAAPMPAPVSCPASGGSTPSPADGG